MRDFYLLQKSSFLETKRSMKPLIKKEENYRPKNYSSLGQLNAALGRSLPFDQHSTAQESKLNKKQRRGRKAI